jgi:hypothetical protein
MKGKKGSHGGHGGHGVAEYGSVAAAPNRRRFQCDFEIFTSRWSEARPRKALPFDLRLPLVQQLRRNLEPGQQHTPDSAISEADSVPPSAKQ